MELIDSKKSALPATILPKDWSTMTLDEIGSVLIGLTYKPTDVKEFGTIVLRSSNVQNGRLAFDDNVYVDMELPERVIVKKGDILICVRNGSKQLIGKCALIDDKTEGSAFGAFMSIYRCKIPDFIFYQFQSNLIQKQIEETLGATINQITNKDLKSFYVHIPSSPAEQTAIATALSDMDSYIRSLEKLIEKKRLIKQGVMQELLSPVGKDGKMKEGWVVRRLGEVAEIYRGGSPRPIEKYLTTSENGINWIKIGDVMKFAKYIENTEEKIIQEGISRSRLVHEGDFLLSNSMSFGRPYILRTSGCIHDGWLVIQNYQSSFERDFLYYILGSESILQQYRAMASGSSVLNLNKEIVKNVFIHCPNTITEQAKISQILSNMDDELVVLEGELNKCIFVKQGMMQQLLTGKIRLLREEV